MKRSATLSPNRLYRYVLWRVWDDTKPLAAFIGLNPSTADEQVDDPTIGRCNAYVKRWGFGGYAMVNLFAWRSTIATGLLRVDDPVGADNDKYLLHAASKCALVVAAWGNGPLVRKIAPGRVADVVAMFDNLSYLKLNDDGTPGHPLYLKSNLNPQIWSK